MATSISAATTGTANTDTTAIDEIDATSTDSIDTIDDNFDTTSLEETLNKAGAEEGLSGVIKSFAEVITKLVSSFSKILEKFTAKTASTSKKAKTTTKKTPANASKKAKAKAKKEAAAAKKAAEAEASKAVATVSTEIPKAEIAAQSESVQTLAATTSTNTKIDPDQGYSDNFLSVSTNKQGAPEIYTEDGYILKFENNDQAWNIITPDGKTNRIWGDPHVIESDGDSWDFKERSTFIFGNNKVTVETVPYGNGQTLTSKVTIYNGDSRVSVSGIDKNQAVFEALCRDAQVDDALREDGDIFILGKEQNNEDRFVLLKDVGAKFDEKFAKQVGVGDLALRDKYLTSEQTAFLK